MNSNPPDNPDTSRVLSSVNDAARHLGLIAPFVLTCAYVLITAGSVTHETLLKGQRLKLPLLLTEVSLEQFFLLAPLLLVVLHAFLLFQQWVLRERLDAAWKDLGEIPEDRRLRYVYPSLPVLRSTDRQGAKWTTNFARLFYFLAMTAPLGVILFMQRTIVPLHNDALVSLYQFLVFVEAGLVLFFWPSRPSGLGAEKHRWKNPGFWVGVLVILPSLAFSLIAVPPAEDCRWRHSEKPLLGLVAEPVHRIQERWVPTALQLPGFQALEGEVRLNLEGRSLRCADLRGAELPGVVLRGADLRVADLSGAVLTEADMSPRAPHDARLLRRSGSARREVLSGVEAKRPRAEVTILAGAKLDGAVLTGASMVLADASRISAREANLALAEMTRIDLTGADLFKADLRGAEVSSSTLNRARFDFAQLLAANFFNSQAYGTDFLAADARLVVFDGSDLNTARFYGADLQGGSFRDARHYGGFFALAKLQGVQGLAPDEMLIIPGATVDSSLICPEPREAEPRESYLRGVRISETGRQELAQKMEQDLDKVARMSGLEAGSEPDTVKEARDRSRELFGDGPDGGEGQEGEPSEEDLAPCDFRGEPERADEVAIFTAVSQRLLAMTNHHPAILCAVLQHSTEPYPLDPVFQEVLRQQALAVASPIPEPLKQHLRNTARVEFLLGNGSQSLPCRLR